jgi:hypothetical protein
MTNRFLPIAATILLLTNTTVAEAQDKWFRFGIGGARHTCDNCSETSTGLAAAISGGIMPTAQLRIGGSVGIWYGHISNDEGNGISSEGYNLAGTVMPVVELLPFRRGGLFLRGGAGFGLAGDPSGFGLPRTSFATTIGAGYDIATSPSYTVGIAASYDTYHNSENKTNVVHFTVSVKSQF